MVKGPNLRFDISAHDRTRNAFNSVQRSAQKVRGTFARGLFAGALAGVAASFLNPIGKIKESLEEFDALGKRIRTSGFSSDFFQTIGFAALEQSVDQERLNKAMEKFAAIIGEAKTGRGEFTETLRESHPELVREVLAARDMDEAFRKISEAVRKADSADEKALITKAAFGARMIGLTRVLNLGANGLDNVGEKARRLGIIIDQSLLDNAEKLQNEFDVASKAIDVQFKSLLIELAPVIVEVAKAAASLAKETKDLFGDDQKTEATINKRLGVLQNRLTGVNLIITKNAGLYQETTSEIVALAEALDLLAQTPAQAAAAEDTPGTPAGDQPITAAEKKAQKVVDNLRFEADQLRRTAAEQAVFNKLKAAGVSIDTQRGQLIADLTLGNLELAAAQAKANEQLEFFGGLANDALSDLIFQGAEAEDVMRRVAIAIGEAALQAALLGQGPFGGGGGGGQVGGIVGAIGRGLLGFQSGGAFRVGGAGGPDSQLVAFKASPDETVSISRPGQGGGVVVRNEINIDARGAQAGVAEQLEVLLPVVIERASSSAVQKIQTEASLRPTFLPS